MLEAKITQIFVNRVAAVHQLVELGPMRSRIGRFPANAENKNHECKGQKDTRDRNIEITQFRFPRSRGERARASRARGWDRRLARGSTGAASAALPPRSRKMPAV